MFGIEYFTAAAGFTDWDGIICLDCLEEQLTDALGEEGYVLTIGQHEVAGEKYSVLSAVDLDESNDQQMGVLCGLCGKRLAPAYCQGCGEEIDDDNPSVELDRYEEQILSCQSCAGESDE